MPDLPGRHNRITLASTTATWNDIGAYPLDKVSAFLSDRQLPALSAVWAAVHHACELLVSSPGRIDEHSRRELRGEGFTIHADGEASIDALERRPAVPGRIWLTTSGTTGRPKRVAHDLASLTTVTSSQPSRTWLLPYSPGTYAWWQLVTLSLAHAEQHLVAVDPEGMDDWPRLAMGAGVTAVSATPTFWRQALYRDPDSVTRLPLDQVTLGGEPVDQAILDQLTAAFPKARVSWIYASSEAGAAIAVHDGREGFPAGWLGRDTPDHPRLQVEGEELLIASPHHAEGYAGLIHTGDRAVVREGRVLIPGRLQSDEINVGGSKIAASRVKAVLLAHPSVAWCAVRGRRAPIVGTIVTADVVTRHETSDQALNQWCAQHLPDYAVPRRVRFLDEIPIKESLKSDV